MNAGEPLYVLEILAEDGALVRRFPLPQGEHAVGSGAEAEVVLEAGGVSRRHASIRVLADGGAVVADLGSKNGTWVGGRRIRETAVGPMVPMAEIAFGPVQAALHPADASREQVLLGSHEALRESAERRRPAPRLASTRSFEPLAQLAAVLEEELPPLACGRSSPAEVAATLAERWIEALPLVRVDVLRETAAGEAIVAAASTPVHRAGSVAGLEVRGPDGWKLRLRAPAAMELAPLAPLFRLALACLAARSSRLGGGGVRGPGRSADEAAAPPPGMGAEMSRLYRSAGKVAKGEVPVLILGESGAGKEVLAHWVHARSRRAQGPFLAINCAALPRDLLEAELFGIERGVATGVDARPGLLERASGGTVFLDEIGDMAPETQAKVLRVLEGTSVYRVGGRAPVQVDVRFIAATNRNLAEMVEERSFRGDLFHRLAAFEVKLPPLRRRREEIPSLSARFFHRELERNGVSSPGITRAALGALVRYPWPGNVRELQNEIAKAALLLAPGEPLGLQHLSERVSALGTEPGAAKPLLTLEEAMRHAEREAFAVALAAAGGDAGSAMELLGVSRTTWYRKLKELGLAETAGMSPEIRVPPPAPTAEGHVM